MSAVKSSKSSLTQSAYERLRVDMLSGRFQPDERLNMSELWTTMGVSLGAVREALSRLAAEGLLIAEPQRGFRVAPISAEELRDLYRTRIEIEGLCLRRSIEAGGLDWEGRIVAAYHSLSRTPEMGPGDEVRVWEEYVQRHSEFHEALVSGGDSPWLLRLRSQLFDQSQRYRRLATSLASAKRNVDKEHRAIMNAVLSRDADRAVTLMRQHLELTTKILLESIPESGL